jgi:OmpA-OmpF porin, OOP family
VTNLAARRPLPAPATTSPPPSLPPDRRRARRRPAWLGALGALLMLAAPPAWAQKTIDAFELNRFRPSAPPSDWFSLDSLDPLDDLRPAVGLVGDLSYEPLTATLPDGREIAMVKWQDTLHASAALMVARRVRFALSLPVIVHQSGTEAELNGFRYPEPKRASLGDLSVAADLFLLGQARGSFRAALGVAAFLPTHHSSRYAGNERVRVAPRLSLAGDLGPFAYAVRVGFLSAQAIDAAQFREEIYGAEVQAAGAAGVRLAEGLLVGAELLGSTTVTGGLLFKKRSTPVEPLLGLHYGRGGLRAGIGASAGGLTDAAGSPRARFLLRLELAPQPRAPEPRAPEPRAPEPVAAPPPADGDADGIPDGDDACPREAGPGSDDRSKNGCPAPADGDGDGVPDGDDACPDKPGARTDDPQTSGCGDGDNDGILDPKDACPTEAGPANPEAARNGCPLVQVTREQIRITEQVQFATGKATIAAASTPLLEAIAKVLREHPELERVRVEGHTDDRGAAAYNRGLSRRRADAVMRWLVERGKIEPARLESVGVGPDRPIAGNDTVEGRQSNRRVELHIVDPPPEG